MAKRSDPALPLYASDLLADEKFGDLSRELRGSLVLLWCVSWKSGPIAPESFRRVCRQIDATEDELDHLLRTFFVEGEDGRWFSRRLEDEREEREEIRRQRAESGRSGASSRWGNGRRGKSGGIVDSNRDGKPDGKPDGKRMADGMAAPVANGWPSASASTSPSISFSPSSSASDHHHHGELDHPSSEATVRSTRTTGTGGGW